MLITKFIIYKMDDEFGAVVSGMERFVFKGVASNLVTYLTDVMKMSNSSAAKTVSSWCGFTSMLPLLVAPLADSYWDRYSTILASAFLYVLVICFSLLSFIFIFGFGWWVITHDHMLQMDHDSLPWYWFFCFFPFFGFENDYDCLN